MKNSFLIFCIIYLFCKSVWSQEIAVTILHTNDLHSYFWGNGPDTRFTPTLNDDPVLGNYARLAQAIDEERTVHAPKSAMLTLDAGDWFGGTIFHALAARGDNSVVPELFFMARMHYDMITLGNHEFDAGEKGLATMLKKYQAGAYSQTPLALVVSNNRQWGSDLQPYVDNNLIKTRLLKTLQHGGQTLKVGLLGALGPDGSLVSATRRRTCTFFGFDELEVKTDVPLLVEELKKHAAILKEEGAQALILVIHAGTPEDEEIAKLMPELDVIIAGHTHELYLTPKQVGKTIIAQAGEYAKYLGVLPLVWRGDRFHLQPAQHYHRAINDSITPRADILAWINELWGELNIHCQKHGAKCQDIIYELAQTHPKDIKNPELGQLLTSLLREELQNEAGVNVDLYFTSMGLVRSGLIADSKLTKTPQWFSDIFRVFPLGINEENLDLGYRTVMFYLPKREVELLINFMEIYSKISKNFTPAFSQDLSYEVRWWGIPMLNRLKDLSWRGKKFQEWPERLSVATNDFVASYLDKVGKMTYGLVEFHPTDAQGKAITKPVYEGPPEFEILMKGLKSKAFLP